MDDDFDDLYGLVERLHPDYAALLHHCVECRRAARQRARMGHCGRPAFLADADLEDDHGLAVCAGKSACCLELPKVLDRFKIAEDDPGGRIPSKKCNVVGAVEADLIATRNQLPDLDSPVSQDVIGIKQDTTALADQGHLAGS